MPASGIRGTHDIPLGSHLCLFYRRPQDFLHVTASFLMAGLADHELCVWIIPPPMSILVALDELSDHGLNGPALQATKQLQISSSGDWYGESAFDIDHSLKRLAALPPRARQLGYGSVRAVGGPGTIYLNRISPGLYALRAPSHDTHCGISHDRLVLLCLNSKLGHKHDRHHEGPSTGVGSHRSRLGEHLS